MNLLGSSCPQKCVARSTLDERPGKLLFVAIVNGVVRCVRYGYEKLRIEDVWILMTNVFDRHWVHVVDVNPSTNLVTIYAKITTEIASDDVLANVSPFS